MSYDAIMIHINKVLKKKLRGLKMKFVQRAGKDMTGRKPRKAKKT